MSAPTEAEIRAELADTASYPKDNPLPERLRNVIREWSAGLWSAAFDVLESPDERDDEGDGILWRDLRPSEAIRLRALVQEARDRAAKRCEAIIVDELTAAGLAFAAEYPLAPRAKATA